MLSVLCVLHEVAQDVSRARDEGLRWPVRCCLPLLCGWRLRRSRRLYGWTLTVSTCSVVLRVWWSRCTVTRSTVRRSRNVLRPCAHSGGAVFEFALPKLRATQRIPEVNRVGRKCEHSVAQAGARASMHPKNDSSPRDTHNHASYRPVRLAVLRRVTIQLQP